MRSFSTLGGLLIAWVMSIVGTGGEYNVALLKTWHFFPRILDCIFSNTALFPWKRRLRIEFPHWFVGYWINMPHATMFRPLLLFRKVLWQVVQTISFSIADNHLNRNFVKNCFKILEFCSFCSLIARVCVKIATSVLVKSWCECFAFVSTLPL